MLDICFAFIAAKFRGRQIDDIRAEYNIEEEFTRLEEEKIKRENPWTEDESVDRLTLK